MSDQGDCEQVPDYLDRDDVTYVDDQGNHHDRVEVVDGSMRGDSVNQQPEVRSMRTKRPNSKYDPAVYGLDSLFSFLQ